MDLITRISASLPTTSPTRHFASRCAWSRRNRKPANSPSPRWLGEDCRMSTDGTDKPPLRRGSFALFTAALLASATFLVNLLLPVSAAAQAQAVTVTEIKLVKNGLIDTRAYTGGPYKTRDKIWVYVRFSEDILFRNNYVLQNPPSLTLLIGNQEREAKFSIATDADMRFNYKVVAQDSGPIRIKANSLRDNGNTIYRRVGDIDSQVDQAVLSFAEVDTRHRVGPVTRVQGLETEALHGKLKVNWTAATDAPWGYLVRWRERRRDSSLNSGVRQSDTSYTISELTNGQTYIVRVDKLDSTGKAVKDAQSAVVGTPIAVTELKAPTGLTATPLVNGVSVSWEPVNGATGYKAYVKAKGDEDNSEGKSSKEKIFAYQITGTTATWLALKPGITYTVSVIATADGFEDSPAGKYDDVRPEAPQDAGESAIKAIYFSFNPPLDRTGTFQLGEKIQILINFKRPVDLDTTGGKPSIGLKIGETVRQLSLLKSGSSDNALFANYFVKAGDLDTDGVSIEANAISLNGGKISDADKILSNMDLSHSALPDDPNRKVNGNTNTNPNAPKLDLMESVYISLEEESKSLTVTATDADNDDLFYWASQPILNREVLTVTPRLPTKTPLVSGTSMVQVMPHRAGIAVFSVTVEDSVLPRKYDIKKIKAYVGVGGLSYPKATTELTVGTAIEAISPEYVHFEPGSTINYEVTGGTLPGGLTLDTSTGVISGEPTTANSATTEVTVTATGIKDRRTQTATATITFPEIVIGGSNPSPVSLLPLEITPKFSGLPTVGVVATLTGLVKGGQEPYRYVWTVADEPEGSAVTLTGANTAEPAFTPTRQGGYELRVTVTDADGATATATVSADADHPGAATGLTAKPAGSGALAVTWTAAARAPHGYRLRWRVRGTNDLNEGVVVHGTGHRLTGLTNGTKYVVRVDTINATADGLVRGTRVTTAGIPSANSDTLGVPTVAVHDAQADEGDSLAFRITLSEAVTHEVKVRWRTVAGTARAGVDYESDSGEVVFASSETEQTVMVRTIDDAHNDPGETFRLVLSDVRGAVFGDGEAVGTISNSDPLPGVWLAHFGRTVADQVLDGIAQRVETPRTPGTQGTLAGVAIGSGDAWSEEQLRYGITPLKFDNWNAAGLSLQNERTMTFSEVLAASRFTLTGARDQAGGSLALWGRGARSSFDAQPGTLNLDGSVTTAILGADYGDEVSLSGVALAWSDGEGSYRDSGQKPEMAVGSSGTVAASLGAVIPYTSVQAAERLGLWGAAGYGSGTMTLTPKTQTGVEAMQTEDPAMQADIDWRMAAVGLRGELLTSQEAQGVTLAVVSDALWAQTDSAKVEQGSLAASASDVTRLRLGLKGRWSVPLQQGGQFAPSFEAGVRHDGGDAGSGLGVELGGGLSWAVPRLGLAFELSGRTLLAHESDGRQEHGLAATLGYDINPGSAQGLSFTLGHTLGMRSEGGLEALFAPETLDTRRGTAAEGRWTAEAAYGLPVFGQYLASPTIEIGVGSASRDYSLGWRLSPAGTGAADIALGIKATRQERVAAEPEHGVRLQLNLRW